MLPLERGARNAGEQAMLAMPRGACGAYIGFVGRELPSREADIVRTLTKWSQEVIHPTTASEFVCRGLGIATAGKRDRAIRTGTCRFARTKVAL